MVIICFCFVGCWLLRLLMVINCVCFVVVDVG